MNFLKYSKIFFSLAILTMGLSLYAIFAFGLNLGIDFEGGSLISITYTGERPSIEEIKDSLSSVDNLGILIQPLGENEISLKIREKDISSNVFSEIINLLPGEFDQSGISIETISPTVGQELKDKTFIVVVAALLAMLAYIALAFRNVPKPITPFQYGISSTLTLFHDIIIPLGFLAFVGHYYGVQVNIPVITALLTIVGYSINNNIVIFDRIRENLKRDSKSSYGEIVNKSLNETIVRCINTSITVLIALAALYYFFANEESLKYFTLIMGLGVIIGLYSAIFLASPSLVAWNNYRRKK